MMTDPWLKNMLVTTVEKNKMTVAEVRCTTDGRTPLSRCIVQKFRARERELDQSMESRIWWKPEKRGISE